MPGDERRGLLERTGMSHPTHQTTEVGWRKVCDWSGQCKVDVNDNGELVYWEDWYCGSQSAHVHMSVIRVSCFVHPEHSHESVSLKNDLGLSCVSIIMQTANVRCIRQSCVIICKRQAHRWTARLFTFTVHIQQPSLILLHHMAHLQASTKDFVREYDHTSSCLDNRPH